MALSFFENEIKRNNNPNFFNNMKVDELRRNVKKIIRDIHSNLIADNHYQFFTNEKVISACIQEAKYQMDRSRIIYNSLQSERNNMSINNLTSIYCNINMGAGLLTELLNEYGMKTNTWWCIYEAFCNVQAVNDTNQIIVILKSAIQPVQKNVMHVL